MRGELRNPGEACACVQALRNRRALRAYGGFLYCALLRGSATLVLIRKLLKLTHTLSAVGLAGGLAAYMLALSVGPDVGTPAEYAALRTSLAWVSKWLITPSMLLVLVSGLLAMAAFTPYMNAPWVWVKAVSGILVFEATLGAIDAPAQRAAAAAARAVNGEISSVELAELVRDEWGAWYAILGLSVANVIIAIWRPRFGLKKN